MFIGHLPAGYLLTKSIQAKFRTDRFMAIGLLASILPDVDILYFYLIDHRQNLHHGYWIHIPFYWMLLAVVCFSALFFLKRKNSTIAFVIFFGNIFAHLILDTIVGKIEWLYPFSNIAISLFEVPNVYGFWIYNFIFHWTFLLEIAVLFCAGFVLLRKNPFRK